MHTLTLSDGLPLDSIAQKVLKARRVVVVTGAGVSCSAGIPDFRSKDGLYNLVKKEHPKAVVKGQELFDASLFRDRTKTRIFHTFMAKLRREMLDANPTPTHHFLRHLKDKGRLLRCYTQNIDGYEARVGLNHEKVVMLHGNIHKLKCTACRTIKDWSEYHAQKLESGSAPICSDCDELAGVRHALGKRKRQLGVLRPTIVLYGEEHPEADLIGTIAAKDARAKPDMMIVLGTSLRVDGIKKLVKDMAKSVHSSGGIVVFINATTISQSAWDDVFDYHVETGADEWVADLRQRVPDLWRVQTRILPSDAKAKAVPRQKTAAPYPLDLRQMLEKDLLPIPGFDVFQATPQPCARHELAPPISW